MENQKKSNKGSIVLIVILSALTIMVWGFVISLFLTSKKSNDNLTAMVTEEVGDIKDGINEELDDKLSDEEFKKKVTLAEEAYSNQNLNDAIKFINEALSIKNDEIAIELKNKYIEEQDKEKEEDKENLLKNINKEYDDMTNQTWYKPKGELYHTVKNGSEKFIFYAYIGEANNQKWIRLKSGFARENWIFTEQIIIKADSNRFTIDFNILDNRKTEVISGGIGEWIDVEVGSDLLNNLKEIISAEEAKIRYQGDTYYTEYSINSTQKKQLKDIIDYYELIK